MIFCGMSLSGSCINAGLSICVLTQKLDMSMVKYGAPGTNRTEVYNILIGGRLAVGLLASMRQTIQLPYTVRRDLCFSSLSSL